MIYGGAGIGATAYETFVNALNDNGESYSSLFTRLAADELLYKNRKDVRKGP